MFKKLSAALVAASLVAVSQPALAQAITPTAILVNEPVLLYGANIQRGPSPSCQVGIVNFKYSRDALSNNIPARTALKNVSIHIEVTKWMINGKSTEITWDGVKEPNVCTPILNATDNNINAYCLMSGYLINLAGIITRLDCSSDKSLVNKKTFG